MLTMDDELATFNPATQQIEYHRPKVVIRSDGVHSMVDIVQRAEAANWDNESDPNACRSNHVSLSVSAGHDMYVRFGEQKGGSATSRPTHYYNAKNRVFHNAKASEMLSDDPHAIVKVLANAQNGVADAGGPELDAFFASLDLRTPTQVEAFIQLYGYWCGDGSLRYNCEVNGKSNYFKDAITFAPVKEKDQAFLRDTFRAAGLKEGTDYSISNLTKRNELPMSVYKQEWFDYFDSVYAIKYAGGRARARITVDADDDELAIKSAKGLDAWVWKLNKDQLRMLIYGVRLADGSIHPGEEINTSSVRFRDDLVQACLHAGYAAYFQLGYEKGSVRGLINGKTIVANHASWRVVYSDSPRFAEPTLHCARDISKRQYAGSIWCVNVQNHYVIARRAFVDAAGVVTKASKPVITGKCPFFMLIG
jgi:hypothetical protein